MEIIHSERSLIVRSKTILVVCLLALICLLQVGCSVRAQHLRSQPLISEVTVDAGRQTDNSFLIYPFDELRGGQYCFIYPTNFIPIINFFHGGLSHKYPETAGVLRGQQGFKQFASVGALDSSMPYLLADMMRKMKFTNNVVPIEEANIKTNLGSYDYVIRGKLNKAKLETHVNPIPLGILSIIGAPCVFHNFTLDYDILLFKSTDVTRPIFQKTYHFDKLGLQGMYYGQSARFDLFIGGLEDTLPEVVNDIADNLR